MNIKIKKKLIKRNFRNKIKNNKRLAKMKRKTKNLLIL